MSINGYGDFPEVWKQVLMMIANQGKPPQQRPLPNPMPGMTGPSMGGIDPAAGDIFGQIMSQSGMQGPQPQGTPPYFPGGQMPSGIGMPGGIGTPPINPQTQGQLSVGEQLKNIPKNLGKSLLGTLQDPAALLGIVGTIGAKDKRGAMDRMMQMKQTQIQQGQYDRTQSEQERHNKEMEKVALESAKARHEYYKQASLDRKATLAARQRTAYNNDIKAARKAANRADAHTYASIMAQKYFPEEYQKDPEGVVEAIMAEIHPLAEYRQNIWVPDEETMTSRRARKGEQGMSREDSNALLGPVARNRTALNTLKGQRERLSIALAKIENPAEDNPEHAVLREAMPGVYEQYESALAAQAEPIREAIKRIDEQIAQMEGRDTLSSLGQKQQEQIDMLTSSGAEVAPEFTETPDVNTDSEQYLKQFNDYLKRHGNNAPAALAAMKRDGIVFQ